MEARRRPLRRVTLAQATGMNQPLELPPYFVQLSSRVSGNETFSNRRRRM